MEGRTDGSGDPSFGSDELGGMGDRLGVVLAMMAGGRV